MVCDSKSICMVPDWSADSELMYFSREDGGVPGILQANKN